MDIYQIRQLVAEKILLTKDGEATEGEKTYSFVTAQGLREALKDALPEGVGYATHIECRETPTGLINVLKGQVFVNLQGVYESEVAMPLYLNPFDAAGAITVLKKALVMSMFDLVPDEASGDKLELDQTAMGALVKIASEEGFMAAHRKGNRHYQLTPKAIETLRKAAKKVDDGATKD